MHPKFSRGGLHCVHLSAPFGGPAFEVVCAALSGAQQWMDKIHERPKSFELLAPSSLSKYDQFTDAPTRKERQLLQRRILGGLEPNTSLGTSSEDVAAACVPVAERPADWRFMQPERVRKLFELGSLYTHEENRAGHAVLRRLTEDELDLHIPEGWYLRCFLHSKRVAARVRREDVVLDHPDYCVLDKPRGLPSVSTNDNYVENAIYLTGKVLGQKVWSVHRLDIPTSGCLILAKSGAASGAIQKHWAAAEKCYSLVVQAEDVLVPDAAAAAGTVEGSEPPPPPPPPPPVAVGSTVTHWMDTSTRGAPKPISAQRDDALRLDKECSLVLEHWEPLPCDPETRQARAFARVRLLTGRTHQIRSQMAQLGWPLQDDIMYRRGFDLEACEREGISFFDPPLSLRCYRLRFRYEDDVVQVDLPTGPHY